MLTRIEVSIESEIAKASSELCRLQLLAKRAGIRARLGRLDEARSDISLVRSRQSGYQPELIGSLQLSEAEIEHYAGNERLSFDHARRAYAIAIGTGSRSLHAGAAAWMAVSHFISGSVQTAIELAAECLERRTDAEATLLGRALLVIADCWAHAGNGDKARGWYEVTRRLASQSGDVGLQSACLYNAAAFALAEFVHSDCFGEVQVEALRALRIQIESVRTLDSLIRNRALVDYGPMLEADLLVVERRWSDAASAFQELSGTLRTRPRRLEAKHLATRAWCAANLGLHEDGIRLATESQQLTTECVDIDDLAITEARLAQTLALLAPGTPVSSGHRSRSERYRRQHLESIMKLHPSLQALLGPSEYLPK